MGKSPRKIEWLAGLLEGEGHFRWDRRPVVILQMTDQDVVERAASILGVSVMGPYAPRSEGNKPMWHCHAYGVDAAGWMMTLYSLMGERRKGQIKKALASWKSQPTRRDMVEKMWARG